MRPFPLTVLKGGIDRLRIKGGASADRLYDLQNAYITNAGSISPREGTIRAATLDTNTVGLAANAGLFNIFSNTFSTSTATVPAGYQLNVLVNPTSVTSTPTIIWFAKPFMGFLYVAAQFDTGAIYHYWLQSNGVWASNTVYKTGNIVTPTVPNGLAYLAVRDFPPNPTWAADSNISLGQIVEPTEYTGFAYEAVSISGQNPGLLYHFDGNFKDSGGYGIADAIPIGGAATTTSPVKFGTGSLNLTSSTAYTITSCIAGSVIDLEGDFTMECWCYPANLGPNQTPFSLCDSSSTTEYAGFKFNTAFNVIAFVGQNGSSGVSTPPPNNQAWNHLALCCSGTKGYAFVNGQQISGSPFNITVRAAATNARIILGGEKTSSAFANPLNGYIDDFRVTKGIALYTANFTPPTAAFAATSIPAHTGSSEPVWPTVSGGTIQEFGDFDTSATDAGTTQATVTTSGALPLGQNLTDRYGDSSTIANAGTPPASSLTLPTTASTLVTTWKPGTKYAPGAVVQPTTNQGAFINAIPNGDFENGNDGNWTFTGITPWAFTNSNTYQGNFCIQIPTGNMSAGGDFATMTNFGVVSQGQSVTATAYLNPNNVGANLDLWVQLNWYDTNDIFLSGTAGVHQEGGGYRKASVTGTAPANAVHCRVAIGAGSGTNSRNTGYADLVSWNLATPAAVSNFLYEAVQVAPASSGQTQPTWPTTQGATVVDGGVTWQAVGTSIITWEAIPLMLSGTVQPTFPTTVGNSVNDTSTFTDINGKVINTHMSWQCISRQITDPKCPNTNSVALGASHVFAGDKDIVDFSAAVDPTDWSTSNNAGYLPTGLNNYGDNPVAMLALYRSNLMAFNSNGYQMWQIDPDPANMALLDAQPVGSVWPRAAQSVANDLLFLTEVGVRNLGTIGATANMQIGNTGQPIDPLVVQQMQGGNVATVFAVTCADVYNLSSAEGGYVSANLSTASFANLLTTGGSILPTTFNGTFVAGVTGNQDGTNHTDYFLYLGGNHNTDNILLSVNGVDTAGNPYTLLGVNASKSYNPGSNITQFYWQNATTDFPFPITGVVDITLTAPSTGILATGSPISLYYPGRGQYWLIFGPQAFVLTINGQGIRSWSRYIFPDTITDWTINNGILYLRTKGNLVWQFDSNTVVDDSGGANTPFNGVIQWPYLDCGPMGLNKMMVGVDIIGDGDVILQVGFDQADKSTFNDNANFSSSTNVTAPYNIAIADTVPGEPLPIPINAPSYTVILTFPGGQFWTWEAANIYLTDARGAGVTG